MNTFNTSITNAINVDWDEIQVTSNMLALENNNNLRMEIFPNQDDNDYLETK